MDIALSIFLANKDREQWFRKLRNAMRKVLARVQSFVQLRLDCLDKVKLDRKINRSFPLSYFFSGQPAKTKANIIEQGTLHATVVCSNV